MLVVKAGGPRINCRFLPNFVSSQMTCGRASQSFRGTKSAFEMAEARHVEDLILDLRHKINS